jgi:EAL domain-containing protein (putative c-di-GMP-specific phosphodiesterase class I)
LRDADTALYSAKKKGKNRLAVFDADMRKKAVARLRIESELRKAIENELIYLQYQPIVSLQDGRIVSFEALARWDHPERGPIPPSVFVPIAEETGMIVQLGELVLRRACMQTAEWRKRFDRGAHLSISVNVSSLQFTSSDFVESVKVILQEAQLDAENLNLDLTESVLMRDKLCSGVLDELRGKNLALHMDDFGTGYSSISSLNTFPISAVKLDRPFVRDMVSDEAHSRTVKAVIEMAHCRGLKVIAEGVETPEQVAQLQRLHCDFGQGYLFSKPVMPEAVERLLDAGVGYRRSA